jgi:hypothetical protein
MEQDDFDPSLVRHGSISRPARRRSTFRSPRSRLYKTPRNTSSGAEVTNPSPGTARLPRPRAMRVRFDWDYDGIAPAEALISRNQYPALTRLWRGI